MTTYRPQVFQTVLLDEEGSDTTQVLKDQPWLATADADDLEFAQNDLLISDRMDGTNFVTGVYLYRKIVRVHMKMGFLG